ncbi:Beta-1,4-galactosyltransferase 1 [Triplophysa tibetana]|uniref:Beta-1,4-galactosyltransferase n=1 Tax=Triplophysa tibetana TaxID=1572043 RepID=A0A5A9NJP2_9TELE|nr:Beta-1,4-galactosyltransferase 1 [Triplophysa tibetana]
MRDSSMNFSLLHRTCSLVVLLCLLHIFVTVIYYVKNSDSRQNFLQNQQNPQIHRKLTEQRVSTEEPTPPSVFNVTETAKKLETCPDNSPRLDCIAQQKVAMIIPFRNRDEHLKFWLYYLHPILQRQQLDYGVYVINQDGDVTFNRAKLLNIGYKEAMKEYDYDCFVFSDVDLIPMDDRNIYKCFNQPRHLSVSMDKFGFRLPYTQYFGGVSSLSKDQYLKINGFPNNYWGWGGEDDDIFNRFKPFSALNRARKHNKPEMISSKGMSISRPDGMIGRCRMIRHERDKQNDDNPQRFDRIAHTRDTMAKDGINSLTYEVVKVEKDQLFTKITVDVGKL